MNPTRGTFQPRGRGRGGRRGRGGYSNDRNVSSPNVPTILQVSPGVAVSIVLKEDQSTGREVQGIVGELLTNGNHPRGIKVRLQDGRVGRVQRMVTDGVVASTSTSMPEPSEAAALEGLRAMTIQPRPTPAPSKYSDFRADGYAEPAETPSLSLEDYVVVKKIKGKGKGRKRDAEGTPIGDKTPGPVPSTAMSTCPVCGEFEGDEAAVAHHVEGHFK